MFRLSLVGWGRRRATPKGDADAHLDQSLRAALVESRSRYKQLVELSSDFAFETDAEGRFTFVSPKGALGYAADELVGRSAAALALDPADWVSLFAPRRPIIDAEIWVKTRAGEQALLLITAAPFGVDGRPFAGARGVARDITEVDAQSRALARADLRERLLFRILCAGAADLDPAGATDAVSEAIASALGCSCRIVAARDADAASDEASISDRQVIAIPMRHRGRTVGVLRLARSAPQRPFDDEERALASALAGHVGLLMAQADLQKELASLARTDPLTGLFNRRAFLEEAERRLARIRGGQGQAALVLIDLDNFKPINDRLGHAAGDNALIAVANHLNAAVRGSDLAARLGGDEFALWLAGADCDAGVARAAALARATAGLVPAAADAGIPLGLSAGVAWIGAGVPGSLVEAFRRADSALYAAKASGKGRAVRAGKAA